MTTSSNSHRPELPSLSFKQLCLAADTFLKKYHNSDELLTPIEDIVDLKLNMSILPISNLERDFGLDAYLSHGMNRIMIDNYSYTYQEARARFSIAHEVGHVVLHKDFYLANAREEPVGILAFMDELPALDVKYMENQAHTFAAEILMPREKFKTRISELIGVKPQAEVSTRDLEPIILDLSEMFNVSAPAVLKHMGKYASHLMKNIDQT